MRYWCCTKADLPRVDCPDYGDVAIVLCGRSAYVFDETDRWLPYPSAEKEVKEELEEADELWLNAPGNTTHETTYYPPEDLI